MSQSAKTRPPPTYASLVRRIRTVVESALPPHANVLVVGKGDREIAKLGTRRTSPFPQDESGEYPGHYPADTGSVIQQLTALGRAGAEYILFPRTAYWWLDHYQGLLAHLDDRGQRVRLPSDECRIWSLPASRASSAPCTAGADNGSSAATASAIPSKALDSRIDALLDALLERGARIVHFREPGDPELNSPDHVIQSVDAPAPTYPEMPEALMALREQGVEVVLLAGARSDLGWSDSDVPSIRAAIERWLPRIVHREHLCSLYDLQNGGRLRALPTGSASNGTRHA